MDESFNMILTFCDIWVSKELSEYVLPEIGSFLAKPAVWHHPPAYTQGWQRLLLSPYFFPANVLNKHFGMITGKALSQAFIKL